MLNKTTFVNVSVSYTLTQIQSVEGNRHYEIEYLFYCIFKGGVDREVQRYHIYTTVHHRTLQHVWIEQEVQPGTFLNIYSSRGLSIKQITYKIFTLFPLQWNNGIKRRHSILNLHCYANAGDKITFILDNTSKLSHFEMRQSTSKHNNIYSKAS